MSDLFELILLIMGILAIVFLIVEVTKLSALYSWRKEQAKKYDFNRVMKEYKKGRGKR
ncbi:hypothetical protein IGK74_002369 [Enterococcus sp. AZ150]|uniref:hypothetical protein n=1 Tax=Enterococcus sp. AZ150 TaxID=2774866 RepID=UPI003F2799DB